MPWWDIWAKYDALEKEFEEYRANAQVVWEKLVECRNSKAKQPHPQPTTFDEITGSELNRIVGGVEGKYLTDSKYKLISKKDFDDWLAFDAVDKEMYINEYYDCDDFARDLTCFANRWFKGIAIGEIWLKSQPHAVNIFVDIDRKVWYYEPQDDSSKVCDLNDIYFMRL